MNRNQIEEYRKWLRDEENIVQVAVSRRRVKEAILKDLEFVSKMEAEEYTLYRKWLEVRRDEDAINFRKHVEDEAFDQRMHADKVFRDSVIWFLKGFYSKGFTDMMKRTKSSVNDFQQWMGLSPAESFKPSVELKAYAKLTDIFSDIWEPRFHDELDIEGYYDETGDEVVPELEPEVILCKDTTFYQKYWDVIRTFTHTQVNNNNIGRNLFFIVRETHLHRILGVFALSSDFNDLKGRDDYIGWSRETRSQKKPYPMVNHTAIGSTILPTQPFGFSYAGGKLIALMAISDVAEKAWNKEYDKKDSPSKLVGVTTTSLYGANAKNKGTQYSNLQPYWEELGESAGATSYEPTPDTMELVDQYLRQEYPTEYWQWTKAKNENRQPMLTNAKQRSLMWLYAELGIDKEMFTTNHKRGIYFCPFFENTKEFLRREISEESALIRRKDFKNDVPSLTKYWRETHAIPRITNLMQRKMGYVETRTFYHDMARLTWEQARDKYLLRVGKMAQKNKAK